jgi:CHAP domain
MAFRTLHLTSPQMHGQDVKDAQYLLAGNNRFKQNYHPGPRDGSYGEDTAAATKRAKYWLGYPNPQSDHDRWWSRVFGPKLYSYLLPKDHKGWKSLPLAYQVRRAARLKAATTSSSVKAKALRVALHEANLHVHEYPWGSNNVKYGIYYGLNHEPWCAMFVTYCFVSAGDKKIFSRGRYTAYAYAPEYSARAGHPYLSITSDPEPGDIVVYHHGQGHIGIFYRWTNRAKGEFQAVEGNTSNGGSQDNGGAVLIQNRDTGWVHTVFVKVKS